MKIVLLVSAMNAGGAQRVAATLLNAWASRRDEVVLIPTFSGRGVCFFPLHPAVRLVYLADLVTGSGSSPLGLLKRFRALRSFLSKEHPDYIVSFLTPVNVATLLASRGVGAGVVVSERTNPFVEKETRWWWRILRRLLYPWADAVLVQTADIVAEFSRRHPRIRRILVVPNPLPQGLPSIPSCVKGNDRYRLRVVAMGRLEREKGFNLLIDAFARLRAKFPRWDLYIWGEGALRGELDMQIDHLGLSGRVVLAGETKEPLRELSAADVFVLSSLWEGFPNVLLEAMALGVAAISFDCRSGPNEITRGGTDAMLVPCGDTAALTEILAKLMNDEPLRRQLGEAGARSVRDRYGTEAILAQWDEVFGQISPAIERE